ncbi:MULTISPECIES: AraC family transcriptional regulator [unclassified Polaromonas]|uniref:helix-turn-helix domain-containing protein n=1 Tax=unclassified Polaromonas TaxID=2638319 RepID=UPI000F081932|nr:MULTISPECIES: helix-turn-helix transcriptional regulator [unclassified Polaromonas]AYQ26601.1 AraC family transcriptional regulator [Polaromonas sp. SP1]QGJ18553.1 helix-turn-helix domain-containing protein [Polaromonas sp. Pch-P]
MKERLFLRLAGDATCGPETTVPAGTLKSFPVAGSMRGHVSQILSYRETLPQGQTLTERVLPDGAVRLMFDFAEVPSAGASAGPAMRVAGASAAPTVLQLGGRLEGVSLALRPGAAAAVLGMPAGAIENSAVSLDALWGQDACALIEQMASTQDDAARVALLTAALQRRISGEATLNQQRASHAAHLVSHAAGRLPLRQVAEAVNVGERRLQQLFFEHIGMSFRAWARLSRLHTCLRLIRRQQGPAWADVAVEAGFYDQAHLANEFRALCGLSPTAFVQHGIAQSSKTSH